MAKLKSLLTSTNANLLYGDFHHSMKALIEREIAKDLDVPTETLIKIVRHASYLTPLHVRDGHEVIVDTVPRTIQHADGGEYVGHLAFAILGYSGSPIFWRKKPIDFSWSRHGVINSKSVKVRLYLDSLDPTAAYEDLVREIAPMKLAVREFYSAASAFNVDIEPRIPEFVMRWAGAYRDYYSRN